MPLFFTMSLCGINGTLFYIVLKPLAKKYLSVQWRRVYLIINILMYLVPLPYFHAQYKRVFRSIPMDEILDKSSVGLMYRNLTNKYIQMAVGKIHIPNVILYIFVTGIVVTSVVLFGKQLYKYYRMRCFLDDDSVEITDLEYDKIREKIPKHVRIYLCGDIDTPFAIGIVHPLIVLPNLNWSEAELSLIIEHEVTHIRQCDNLVKILSLVALALNFYNPLAYYVMRQWNEVAELSCDLKVRTGRTAEEVKMYGRLIIDIAEMRDDSEKLPVMGLNSQENVMKERMQEMKKDIKKVSKIKKLIGAGVMGIALFTSSLPVLAYTPKDVMRTDEVAVDIVFNEDVNNRWGGGSELSVNESVKWTFVSDDGEVVVNIDESNLESEPHLFCKHEYKSGELSKHYVYSDGSCKVEYFKAQMCKWCDDVIIGDLITTATWTVCPH